MSETGKDPSQAKRRIVPAQSVPDAALGPEPAPAPPPQRTFFFVDEKSSSKGKRAHVMKHHIQEKKREQKRLLSQAAGGQGRRGARGLPCGKKNELLQRDPASNITGLSRVVSVVWNKDRNETDDTPPPLDASPISQDIPCSLCRQITLRASRSDPFDTLPMELTDESQQLVDCWTTKLAYWSGQNTHMKIAAFKQAMLHPMTFHVMILTYCSRYRAHVLGVKETPQSVQYVSTAERSLSRYIENTGDPYDENIIMAFAALSLQEERYGNKDKATKHINHAMVRLKPRAGVYPFQDTFIHYVRYTMSPREAIQNSGDVYQLLSFLRNAELAAQDYRLICQTPVRMTAFQFSTPLHLLLSSGPHPSHVPNEERRWVVKYGSLHDLCRIASLIYITSSILDYATSPDKCSRFLDGLIQKVDMHHLGRWPSTETLVWMLLEEPNHTDLKDPERAWFVGDIMEIVQKLPQQLNYQFSELLLRFLMLRPPDLEISREKFERDLWTFVNSQQSAITVQD
ncbi:hypothetical protein PRK78_003195 [Emydomyces testavorans]|uniref:Uncharacterized protein n=1 Tax=Emydomyces testavorans TaxID=2070801 RepID=A0AAF0DGC8_9EURO|nr:hypothetical protein PRK78_003195 [Emydomyces testavorans]